MDVLTTVSTKCQVPKSLSYTHPYIRMSMSKVRRNITIEPEHQAWLDENEQVNLSGLVRQTIEDKMEKSNE